MSDEEYVYGSDEDYCYGSENEEEPQDDLIEIENAFYEGDDCKTDQPAKALEMFAKVVELETERGTEVKWRFKALEHLVVLHFRLGQFAQMVGCYQGLLSYVGQVTRNECTDSINNILDTVSGCPDLETVSKMYEVTLDALRTAGNERMWFSTNAKLAKAYLQQGNHARANRTINELHRSCQLPDGSDDPSKGSSLLEVYGLVIQLCTATMNTTLMKEVYPKIEKLNAAVEDPRTMGVIREEGGKMYMSKGQWSLAYNEFYEGFRNYQEAGNKRAKDCLKYVVLANMLALSDINPFAAREAKVFQDEREVAAMLDLRLAYESNDLGRFERTLNNRANGISDDPFIMKYTNPLRTRMREQVLLALVQPYRKVTLSFIAKEVKLSIDEVERLLVKLILDRRIYGSIDQIEGYIELGRASQSVSSKKYDALNSWSNALRSLTVALQSRVT